VTYAQVLSYGKNWQFQTDCKGDKVICLKQHDRHTSSYTEFGADIFMRYGKISISRNSRWLSVAILDMLGGYGPTHDAAFMVRTTCKILSRLAQ